MVDRLPPGPSTSPESRPTKPSAAPSSRENAGRGALVSPDRWRLPIRNKLPPPPEPQRDSTPEIVRVAAAMLAGQAAAVWPAGVGTGAGYAAGAVLLWRTRRRVESLLLLLLCAAAHWQTAGVLRPELPGDHVAHFAGAAHEMRGRVAAPPSQSSGKGRLLIDVVAVRKGLDWHPARGRILATLHRAEKPWREGDAAQGPLTLRRPRNFGNPGEFDYEAHLARQSIYATGSWTSDASWQRQEAPAGSVGAVPRWRRHVVNAIDRTLVGSEREITAALLVGRADLSADLRERYARTGLSHILSISGLHIALVAGAACAVARWLLARSERILLAANVPKLALAASGPPVLLYAALAGASLPTVRSAAMGILLVLATLVDRRRHWLSSLAAAALGISLCWPGSVLDISFQLSFSAVLAIVLGMRRLAEGWQRFEEDRLLRLRGRHWTLARWLFLYLGVTVCATVGTAPLSAWHFNRFSCISLIANPLVVPLLGAVPVGVGLVAAVLAPFAPSAADALLRIVGFVVHASDLLVAALAAVPGAAVDVVSPSPLELALIYALLGAVLLRPGRSRCAVCVVSSFLLLADGGYWYWQRHMHSHLRLTFLSVGQGDSTVVEFPGSSVMVIDAGGFSPTFDTGERIVGPFLWRRKIVRLDQLVLSHPDFDHYGGTFFLADRFAPAEFWWTGGVPGDSALGRRLGGLAARGTAPIELRRGFRRTIDGVEVAVLGPGPSRSGGENDRSLVLRLRYGPTTVLLPGDIERESEAELLSELRHELPATILKAPHHGSRTSSTAAFLDAVAPRLAIVSAGHDNRFGMPHPEVLETYGRRGIEVRRTDRDGAVQVDVDRAGKIEVTQGRGSGPLD